MDNRSEAGERERPVPGAIHARAPADASRHPGTDAAAERLLEELERERRLMLEAEARAVQLGADLERARAELDRAAAEMEALHAHARREHEREGAFRDACTTIHGAVGGDVESLVLEACMRLTGATRGLYVAENPGAGLRVRAAAGVDGYGEPGRAPSEFVAGLCARVLELDDTVVWGDGDTTDLPLPGLAAELFHNCAAVPVALRGDVSGVIVVADKPGGNFLERDIETLLHVGDQAAVAVDNAYLHRELERVYVGTVGMLADAVEAKDPYTRGHCERVSRLARLTADRLGLDPEQRRVVCLAALLHDVGKIAVSDGILNKPGPLMPEERDVVRAHARIGHDLLRSLPALREVAETVLHHHEAWDGSGYPEGLAEDSIPVGSRVVAVIDAFCAMLDRRSYKQERTIEDARAELRRCAGTQFDPHVVEAFLDVLKDPRVLVDGDDEFGCVMPQASLRQPRRRRDDLTRA